MHTFPGVPALSWRGAVPQASQLTSNQPGLQVIYSIDVGVTSKTIVGLQVCWYTPSNANNLFTPGDPTGCNILGKVTATKWTRQACPGDQVVSSYATKANSALFGFLELHRPQWPGGVHGVLQRQQQLHWVQWRVRPALAD